MALLEMLPNIPRTLPQHARLGVERAVGVLHEKRNEATNHQGAPQEDR